MAALQFVFMFTSYCIICAFKNKGRYHFSDIRRLQLQAISATCKDIEGNVILYPPQLMPRSIVHFIGGFIAGSFVKEGYSSLLRSFASSGHLVIATPIIPTLPFNHTEATDMIVKKFKTCYYDYIVPYCNGKDIDTIPVIGLSHSLGCKLTTMINSKLSYRRLLSPSASKKRKIANIFLAYNNYGIKDSIMSGGVMSVMEGSKDILTRNGATNIPTLNDIIVNMMPMLSPALGNGFNSRDVFSMLSAVTSNGNGNTAELLKRLQRLGDLLPAEFDPSPDTLWKMIEQGYNIPQ